ncbi:MAG: helix-turn-helix transcriptional regulator [Thiotrichales bacterium]
MLQLKDTLILLVLAIVLFSNLYDLSVDYGHGASTWHIYQEALLVIVSSTALIWLLMSLKRQAGEIAQLKSALHHNTDRPKPAPKVQAAREHLGKVILEQFAQWKLTSSEQQVAMLLLKGLSFKEIAAVRTTSEKTVRQQASALYSKAGLSGRHELSAWFIEDLVDYPTQ